MFDWRSTTVEELAPGRYRVAWRLDSESPNRTTADAVQLFVGHRPDEIAREQPLATDSSGSIEAEIGTGPRHYFALSAGGGPAHVVSTRQVSLEGASNFRDLGGYYGNDSEGQRRQVRWGRLFRSGHLNGVTDADRERLAGLAIDRVFDFRTERERAKRPNAFAPEHDLNVTELEIDPGSAAGFSQTFSSDGMSEDVMVTTMQELNRNLIRDHAQQYRAVFEGLLSDEAESGACLIQCASGKDRTGMAALLILLALGVDREAVVHDYLLTNRYLTRDHQFTRALKDFGGFDSSLLTPEMLRVIFEVREPYALAALDEIDERFGGTDAYLENQVGLAPEDRAKLKQRYLAR